jgi:hypothetical protein
MKRLTDRQLSNLLLIHNNTSAGICVTSYYGAYWLCGARFEIGRGAMAQLYQKGIIKDSGSGVVLTPNGLAIVEAHNVPA